MSSNIDVTNGIVKSDESFINKETSNCLDESTIQIEFEESSSASAHVSVNQYSLDFIQQFFDLIYLHSKGAATEKTDDISMAIRKLLLTIDQPCANVSASSKHGGKGPVNEDRALAFKTPCGTMTFSGIFDAHGDFKGLLTSEVMRKCCAVYFRYIQADCPNWSIEQLKEMIHNIFVAGHNIIRTALVSADPANRMIDESHPARVVRNTHSKSPIRGGTTATIVISKLMANGVRKVISGNVGDSSALLISITNRTYKMLTVPHSPDNQEEYQRIQSSPEYTEKLLLVYDQSAQIEKWECPPIFLPTGEFDEQYRRNPWNRAYRLHPANVRYEPGKYAVTRSTVRNDTTTIAMTRSLGDIYAHQFGLTHIPSITEHDVAPGEICVVTNCSDGVWDCWKYDDFLSHICSKPDDATTLAEYIVNKSVEIGSASFGSKNYDDTSAVAWQL